METSLGRGYSIHEDFGLTDFYSPPSSVIDDIDEHEDDVLYPEDEEHDEQNSTVPSQDPTLPSSLIDEINSLNISKLFIRIEIEFEFEHLSFFRYGEIPIGCNTSTNTTCFITFDSPSKSNDDDKQRFFIDITNKKC